MSIRIADLDPAFRPYGQMLIDVAKDNWPDFQVTSTRRTWVDQARLYWRYLRGESNLPAAPPGHSMHEKGLAIDIARVGVDPHDDEALAELGAAWVEAGGVWHQSDPVHFQAPP